MGDDDLQHIRLRFLKQPLELGDAIVREDSE